MEIKLTRGIGMGTGQGGWGWGEQGQLVLENPQLVSKFLERDGFGNGVCDVSFMIFLASFSSVQSLSRVRLLATP